MVDATSGTVAVIDPNALTVSSVVRFTPPAGPITSAAAGIDSTGALLVGAGRELITVSLTGGEPVRRFMPTPVRGVATSADRGHHFVGQDDAVLCLETATGKVVRRIAVPGLVSLRQVAARA